VGAGERSATRTVRAGSGASDGIGFGVSAADEGGWDASPKTLLEHPIIKIASNAHTGATRVRVIVLDVADSACSPASRSSPPPEGAHWNADRQAVEFGVEIGEYRGIVMVPRRVFQRSLPERPTPERCVEAYYLQRTRFESIAERKLQQRQLIEDGNVEISGRDLREGAWMPSQSVRNWRRALPSLMTFA